MEQLKIREIKTQEKKHIFYCDRCQKELGESIEIDDGYYEEKGSYEQKIFINGRGWYNLHLCLCDKCKDIYNEKIVETLKNIGFTEEK